MGLEGFYNGKRVLVTGHTGFKGAWLCAWLKQLGAIVRGYSLAAEHEGGLYDHLQDQDRVEEVIADIRDKGRLTETVHEFRPSVVFHLAAQPLVLRSYQSPSDTFEINVTGTANLLEAINGLQNDCTVVVITTDKVYHNVENPEVLYKETDRLGGHDPYSASKACAELVVDSFRSSFFTDKNPSPHKKLLASARAGNVIGGGDRSENRIVPDIVRALERDEAIQVRNPLSVRPWQHVLEPISGYLKLAAMLACEPGKFSGPFNFGPVPKDHLNVRQLVETAIAEWGGGNWQDVSHNKAKHEANYLQLDIAKASSLLGWLPKLDAKQAIAWTLEWYKAPRQDKWSVTRRQITDYCAI